MNDLVAIILPVWVFWTIVAWVSLDAVYTTLRLINQFLAWRVTKLKGQA